MCMNATQAIAIDNLLSAITLTAFFYHLLRSSHCYQRLQSELDTNFPSNLSQENPELVSPISFTSLESCPYLRACVDETFRMHPAFGFNLERVVPEGGANICGHHIPGGTIVGANAWVIHKDKEVFGEDSDQFRPERWVIGQGVIDLKEVERKRESERIRLMKSTMFHFGAGEHVCLGKNVSTMEIYKLVATMMRCFEVS